MGRLSVQNGSPSHSPEPFFLSTKRILSANMRSLYISLVFLVNLRLAAPYKFPYESVQLMDSDIANNSDVAFGTQSGVGKVPCKIIPGDNDWPSLYRWSALNITLGGTLLRAVPPAAACYSGKYENASTCSLVRQRSRSSNFVYAPTHCTFYLCVVAKKV
jgi:hypothetical protein